MRVGSLFAGIGGFDLAAEHAGLEVVWQSEIDRHASAVLDYHWPAVKNLGDIHEIEDPPGVDVLTGGFPCQDYSVAGQRGGLAGDRGALWWEYHRLIGHLRPTWVVGENVPGLLSSRDGADFETIIGSLTELGYGVAWAVLDAQYFGVAQRRRRVFIVGHVGGIPRPEVLALSEGLYGHSAPRREAGQGVAPTLAARTRGGGGLGTDAELDGALVAATLETLPTDKRQRYESGHLIASPSGFGGFEVDDVAGTLRQTLHKGEASSPIAFAWQAGGGESSSGALEIDHAPTLPANQTLAVAHTLTQGAPSAGRRREDDVNLVAFEDDRRTGPRIHDEVLGTLQAQMGTGGNNTPMVAFAQNQRDELRDLDDQAGALAAEPGMKQQTFLAQDTPGLAAVRRLTPLECERLQGFPDGWTDIPGASDTQRYRQLGNAVAVPVVEWLMRRISVSTIEGATP